jgi:hypothetical protein
MPAAIRHASGCSVLLISTKTIPLMIHSQGISNPTWAYFTLTSGAQKIHGAGNHHYSIPESSQPLNTYTNNGGRPKKKQMIEKAVQQAHDPINICLRSRGFLVAFYLEANSTHILDSIMKNAEKGSTITPHTKTFWW